MANKKHNLSELKKQRLSWPQPVPGSIEVSAYGTYLLKKQAVDMYIDGEKLSQIQKTTGIFASRIGHLVDDCLEPDTSGKGAGYCGLLKEKSITLKKNTKRGKDFSFLLEKYPSLHEFIAGNYFGDKKYTLEKNMNFKTLHLKFINECKRLGVMQHEYPFNTATKAYASLCSYVHNLEKQNTALQIKRLDKDSSQKLSSTGLGTRYSSNPLYPFSVVQIDGHIIDMVYTIEIPNEDGTVSTLIATRAWLIAVIDVATRCILGYSVSQEFNYNQYDIMDAIKDAIVPKELKDLSITGISYPANGGFYSTAFPNLRYVLFDSIMLDNAKSHLSSFTLDKLVDGLQCTVNYGSVATPETRGIIERFFQTIEIHGFHKLPMTTGSSISDLKRKDPEKSAIKYHVTYDQITELMDVLIAEYNNTPHSGIDNLSPIECMFKKVYEAGMSPCISDEETVSEIINSLNLRVAERTVRGHVKKGKRPYVQFLGCEYRSRLLAASELYVGQKISIVYDPRDISTLKAYSMEGKYIDTLTARGEFGTKSHSVKTRENALKLARERGRQGLEFDTPIESYMEHLKKESKKSRRAATRSDIVRRETGIVETAHSRKKDDNIIPLTNRNKFEKLPSADDIRNLSAEELYQVLFEERS